MICYITDGDGAVVAQFNGDPPEPKPDHELNVVDTIGELPGVDGWDEDYVQ